MRARIFLLTAILAAAGVVPASSQTAPAAPDFSGIWAHPYWPGFDPPETGPGPVLNRVRKNGIGNSDQLTGDYANPILKPNAAAVVKRHGEISATGVTYPTPANQCWPEPVPYILWTIGIQLLQQKDKVTILYSNPDHESRDVRLNASHPARVVPSMHGDSIGHYEGDTLVVDTVGVRTNRPYAMVDVYGTPYSPSLHVVERYRLVDDDVAKAAEARTRKENLPIPFNDAGLTVDQTYKGKALSLEFTVEDEGVFTMPWKAGMIYRRAAGDWPEAACAENRSEYYAGKDSDVPRADRSDF
jgi:hypothetical protein